MAKFIPTIEDALTTVKDMACTWFKECTFSYEAHDIVGAIGGGFCVVTKILADGFDMGYYVRFERRGMRYHVVSYAMGAKSEMRCADYDSAVISYEKMLRTACFDIAGHKESASAIWPVSGRSVA